MATETVGYLGHVNPDYEALAVEARDLGQVWPLAYRSEPLITRDDESEHWHQLWAAPGGQADLHVWTVKPGVYEVDGKDRPNFYEVTTIMRGHATVQEPGKEPFDLRPGQCFVCPPGWSGTWTVHEYVEKSFLFLYV